jgi:hypothetical protein
MSIFSAMLSVQETDNPVLFSLLFFLNLDNEPRQYDVDAPISDITDEDLTLAVCIVETLYGVDIPDEYITTDKSKSLRDLAKMIRDLPVLPDEEYRKKLKRDLLIWRMGMSGN